ncbi:MAG: hypothetical protein ACXVJK_09160 [Candidatus Aminicenantales bacterium]
MTRCHEKRGRGAGWHLLGFSGAFLGLCLAMIVPAVGQEKPGLPVPKPSSAEARGLPSESTAAMLSWAVTGASFVLLFMPATSTLGAIGTLVGPSVGYFYGGCVGRGVLGLVLRAGVDYLAIGAAIGKDDPSFGWGMLAVIVGATVLDAALVKSTVRKHNQAIMAQRRVTFAVAPFALPKGAGVRLHLSF